MAAAWAHAGRMMPHNPPIQETAMTLCPVALVSGCAKCPIFKPCPLKGVIGDYVPPDKAKSAADSSAKPKKS